MTFTSSGVLREPSTDAVWRASHNCTKVTQFSWGNWTQTMRAQCYDTLHEHNSCEWRCAEGFFRADTDDCQACNASSCDVGYYRTDCTPTADGECIECTNPHPAGTIYSSAGIPYSANACVVRCENGFFPTSDLAGPLCIHLREIECSSRKFAVYQILHARYSKDETPECAVSQEHDMPATRAPDHATTQTKHATPLH